MAGDFFSTAPAFGPAQSSSAPIDYYGAAKDLFSGAGAVMGGIAGSGASLAAAKQYGQAAEVTRQQTAIAQTMAQRKIYQTLSGEQAEVGGAGFQLSGSAQDIMRSSAQQGALTKGAIALQGASQEQAYLAQQKAAKKAASGQLWGGIIKGVADVVGVVAAPFTGGASLALAAAANVAVDASMG